MSNKFISGTFAASGSSAVIPIQRSGIIFVGGAGGANFGSGTVTVQCVGPDGQYYPSATTFTAADVREITFPSATAIRLTLSGATDPDLDYAIMSDQPIIVQ